MMAGMFELKKLTPDALDAARSKASQYRLLNHPFLAESICRDILEVNPDDQEALVILCLTLCDQFGVEGGATVRAAMDIVEQLDGEYERSYYAGMVAERMDHVINSIKVALNAVFLRSPSVENTIEVTGEAP